MARKKDKLIKIITLDTETYNGLYGKLKKLAIYDGNKVYYGDCFRDVEPVLFNYEKMGYEVHIWIHNLEFDMRKIPELFEPGNIIWKKSVIISRKVAKVQCKHYCLHDSFKILPSSLKDLSQGFKVEHGKLDLLQAVRERYGNRYDVETNGKVNDTDSLVNFLDKCPVDDPLFLEYLGYDVISLYEVLYAFMEIAGLSEQDFVKRLSTASVSRFIFKNGYKGEPFKAPLYSNSDYEMLCRYKWEQNLEVEEFLRDSYCGGRTEVFKPRLEVKGYHYDVNSLYPYVMSDGDAEYPVGKPEYTEQPNKARYLYEHWKETGYGLGFLNCHVYVPKQHIPPLPVKKGKLAFPCGHLYGTWTYEELRYAEEECGVKILECYGACHFETTYPVFKRFVGTFYALKEQASREKNGALRMLSKLLLNVGYGYTGMTRDDKTALDDISQAHKHDNIVFQDSECGFIEYQAEIKAEYIQVQVASYVTSRARLVLLKGLKDIEKRGGNVYYCDTDSIVSDIPMSPDIVDGSKIGYWDLEGEPTRGIFIKPKVYTELFDDKPDTVKFKGISRETQKDLDFNFYETLYQDILEEKKDYRIVEKNKMQLRGILHMQKQGLDLDYYEVRDKKMNYKTVEKRIMDYKNNTTEPFYFETLDDFENFTFKKIRKYIEVSM